MTKFPGPLQQDSTGRGARRHSGMTEASGWKPLPLSAAVPLGVFSRTGDDAGMADGRTAWRSLIGAAKKA
jgi:hypothetical protein